MFFGRGLFDVIFSKRRGLIPTARAVMALGLILSLSLAMVAGCAGKPVQNQGQPNQQQGTPAASKEPVKIGGLYILTGSLALYGKAGSQGLQMAKDEINQAGGILGRQVELQVADEQGKPDVATREAKRLVLDWKADALIGVDSSGSVLAVADAMKELQRPLLVTHAATPKLVMENWNKYVFRVTNDARMDAWAAAMLAAKMPYKRWANIGPDYEFGRVSWSDFFKKLKELKPDVENVGEAWPKLGASDFTNHITALLNAKPEAVFFKKLKELKPDVENVGEAWPKLGASDFTNHITALLNAKPEAVFSTVWGGDLVTFIKQAKGFGFFDQVKQFVDPVGASLSVLVPLGKDAPEGMLVSARYWFLYPDTERNHKFVAAYHQRFNEYPDYVAHEGYSALYMYKAAVEKAGSTDPEKVVAALEGLSYDSPQGTKVIRAQDHQVFKDLVWGYTKHTDKYPFAILDRLTVIPQKDVTYPPGNKR